MIREGIIDTSSFSEFHPIVTTVFFALVIGITMFTNDPALLVLLLVAACAYRVLLAGIKELKPIFITVAIVLLFATAINGFFTHNGETVLFFMGANRVTLEAFAFGATMALMLAAVIQWFVCFSLITTSDKMIYIFGALLPVIGLVISMIFRFIPLLKKRFADIDAAQRALAGRERRGRMTRLRHFTKEVSILIAWSLEASIDSADSMAARGYGLRGRTSYHLFRFRSRDLILLILVAALGTAVIAGSALGALRLYFYPSIRRALPDASGLRWAMWCAAAALALLPLCMDLYGEKTWKRYASKT